MVHTASQGLNMVIDGSQWWSFDGYASLPEGDQEVEFHGIKKTCKWLQHHHCMTELWSIWNNPTGSNWLQ